jgi:hypothetical protein
MFTLIIAVLVGVLIFAVLFALGLLYSSLSWGVVLWCFWDWFLIPVFPTVPELGYWKAVGLMFVIDLFKNQVFHPQPTFKPEFVTDDGKKSQMIATYISPWVVLLVGLFIQWFITIVS